MEDLSLHVLDVVENSIEAGATRIGIKIIEDSRKDLLTIEILDNGRGMDEAMVKAALDPFFTTKSIRPVGLGLSLFRVAAQMANGDLTVQSRIGAGTRVKAHFQHSHIDRKPLGDMTKTLMSLIIGHAEIRFKYTHQKNGTKNEFDTRELEKAGKLSSLGTVELMRQIKRHLPAMP